MTDAEQPKNIVHNARVQEALGVWAETKDPQTHSEVLRRAAAGQLLLDISPSEFADPENPMQEGDKLIVTSVRDEDGKDLLLAFTDNPRLEAFAPTEKATSLAQPAAAALKQAMDHHDGIAIDAGTPGAFIAYRDELQRAFGDSPADAASLAGALVDGGVQLDEFVRMLSGAVVYVGGIPVTDDAGETTGYHVASATRADGETLHAVFTSPAELWAWEPSAIAQPTSLDKIVASAREDGMVGLVVNPVGPAAELKLEWFEAAE
ncbi:SseB family protein [Microbacterium excoecariae]|uniref:SseB family protein n=1 Tax=Microbacterium excoecariae TaxID=2715210 RepID=UPI00140AD1B9|nr:SseB family protein [Microbacterium excoecariae]NHI16329.1 SseB family protein [Microbacterium excoecariae]